MSKVFLKGVLGEAIDHGSCVSSYVEFNARSGSLEKSLVKAETALVFKPFIVIYCEIVNKADKCLGA